MDKAWILVHLQALLVVLNAVIYNVSLSNQSCVSVFPFVRVLYVTATLL